jgi:hypothetical protein
VTSGAHVSEEELLLHHYEADADVARHLAGCPECRARLEAARAFLAELTSAGADVPEPDAAYTRELWRRLEPRLPRRRPSWTALLAEAFAPRRLALAGGVFALVIGAFLLGRSWPARPSAIPKDARDRILLVAVGDHLERSQVLLLEVVNSRDAAPARERARAEELVAASRLFRESALTRNDGAVAGVLDDLERLLLDVARAPESLSAEDRDALRRRIDKTGLLFKVHVLGTRLTRETARGASRT